MSQPSEPARDPAGPVVLHVNRVGFLGGVERVILTLSDRAAGQGYRAMVACPGGGELEAAALARGVPVTPLGVDRMRITANPAALLRYSLRWLSGGAELRRICRDHEVEVLHAHHPVGVLYARSAARELGLPLVFHLHEIGPARPLYALALKAAAASASRIICVSEANRRFLNEVVRIDPDRVEVIHNAVDPVFVARAETATACDLGEEGPHIGVFGVLEPRKGQDVFLAAARQVLVRHPGAKFWIIGPAALADKAWFADRLQEIAAAQPLRGAVRFTGFRSDIPELMRAMDAVVLPSVEMESFSMALVEALTLGCRVIGTDVGGTAEAIDPGRTGLVVPPRDPAALAAAIDRMLGLEGPHFGAAAARDARLRFRPEVFARRMAETYAKASVRGSVMRAA